MRKWWSESKDTEQRLNGGDDKYAELPLSNIFLIFYLFSRLFSKNFSWFFRYFSVATLSIGEKTILRNYRQKVRSTRPVFNRLLVMNEPLITFKSKISRNRCYVDYQRPIYNKQHDMELYEIFSYCCLEAHACLKFFPNFIRLNIKQSFISNLLLWYVRTCRECQEGELLFPYRCQRDRASNALFDVTMRKSPTIWCYW